MLLLLCSTSMVVETKLHVMAHVQKLTFVFRFLKWYVSQLQKMMRIMAYVERIIGTFGGIIGRNAKNCRIE